jgi:hypothetical protein
MWSSRSRCGPFPPGPPLHHHHHHHHHPDAHYLFTFVQEAADRFATPGGEAVVALGTAEQNIVVPAQAGGAGVTAVSAILQSSPLALATRPNSRVQGLE